MLPMIEEVELPTGEGAKIKIVINSIAMVSIDYKIQKN
jgi:hypothetical protein